MLTALGVWFATRVAYAVFTYLDLAFYRPAPVVGCTFDSHCSGAGPLTNWFRFDAAWYLNIARDGYFSPQAPAFYPLYPALTRLFIQVSGPRFEVLDAMLIANLAALAALVALAALAVSERWAGTPATAVLLFAAYPLAFFTAAPYSESLFLALAAFALLCARRGRLPAAAALAFLATLTRSTGVVLLLPLLWEAAARTGAWDWLRGRRSPPGRRALAELAAILLAVPLALAAYSFYLYLAKGDPLLWRHAEDAWGRHLALPWTGLLVQARHLWHTAPYSPLQVIILVDTVPLLLFGALTLAGLRRWPVSLLVYQAGLIGLVLVTPETAHGNVFPAAGRFLVASVPIFLLVARWADERPWVAQAWVTTGFLAQAILLAQFMAWTPIGA